MKKNKVLLVGWDAADWKLIGPLLAKGHMPHLERIIKNGVYGNMATMNPPYSPMLWSSVATGKTPDKHRVLGFVELMPDLEGIRPVSTNSRKTRAIWNILHNQGLKSNLVGWWPSYPAEPINGVVISDKYQKVNSNPKKRKPLELDAIHPQNERDNFLKLRMFPMEITSEHILPFIPKAAQIDQDEDKMLRPFARIMSQNVSLHNAATRLLRTSDWDFMAVYHDLIDHFCHSYMKYHPPLMAGVDPKKYEIYNEAVNGAYRFQDMMLGRSLELIDEDTTVIVMSDHGFESGSKRILEMPKINSAPAMEHSQFGIFAAMGPNIKKNEKVFGLGLVDVAPTVLHHLGVPVGRDMDGRVIHEIFEDFEPPTFIESWDKVAGDFGELDKEILSDALSDQEAMEQLIELGYIDRPDLDMSVVILKTKCELKHNLATVYLGLKQYENAKELLLELIDEQEPIDTSIFYKDLIHISLAEKNYDLALTYLNKLKTIRTEVKYNLFFIEAEILDGLNHTENALNLLQGVIPDKGHLSEVWRRVGLLQYKLGNYRDALNSFENAIKIEPDRAESHRAMAETLFNLKEYEESVEFALTSIELINNFPEAHFILGKALEHMGDMENAKIAYTTAAGLRSVSNAKEEMAIENIEEKLKLPTELRNKSDFQYRKDQIVIVSGLPRSGTSLMMQMLEKGGIPILKDDKREADLSNPKGYYEFEPVMGIHKDNSWLGQSKDKAVKVVAPLLKHLDSQYRYKIIFMNRNLLEIIRSQRTMVGKDPGVLPVKLLNSYKRLLENVENWKEKESGIEIIYLDYKDVLNNTPENMELVEKFLGVSLDKEAMSLCIDKKLYRNRADTPEKI